MYGGLRVCRTDHVAPLTAGRGVVGDCSGLSGLPHDLFRSPSSASEKDKASKPPGMGIGNENDQVSKGHLVDALACTGDEGRDTLR